MSAFLAAVCALFARSYWSFLQDEEEQFNSDYAIVERILDLKENDGKKYMLVKWKSLPYEEVTWEVVDIIPEDKIKAYNRRSAYDPLKGKPKPRPTISDWRKIPEDTTFKDGNVLRGYQFEGVNWLLYCYCQRCLFERRFLSVTIFIDCVNAVE